MDHVGSGWELLEEGLHQVGVHLLGLNTQELSFARAPGSSVGLFILRPAVGAAAVVVKVLVDIALDSANGLLLLFAGFSVPVVVILAMAGSLAEATKLQPHVLGLPPEKPEVKVLSWLNSEGVGGAVASDVLKGRGQRVKVLEKKGQLYLGFLVRVTLLEGLEPSPLVVVVANLPLSGACSIDCGVLCLGLLLAVVCQPHDGEEILVVDWVVQGIAKNQAVHHVNFVVAVRNPEGF